MKTRAKRSQDFRLLIADFHHRDARDKRDTRDARDIKIKNSEVSVLPRALTPRGFINKKLSRKRHAKVEDPELGASGL
jgi:hypothetical protein